MSCEVSFLVCAEFHLKLFALVFEGTQLPGDQRQITIALPPHLADVLTVSDGGSNFTDSSGKSKFLVQNHNLVLIYYQRHYDAIDGSKIPFH